MADNTTYKPVQVLALHSDDCRLKDDWDCWIPQGAAYGWSSNAIHRDLTGRSNPRARNNWFVFRCNDPDCHAQICFYYPYFEMQLGIGCLPTVGRIPYPVPSAKTWEEA